MRKTFGKASPSHTHPPILLLLTHTCMIQYIQHRDNPHNPKFQFAGRERKKKVWITWGDSRPVIPPEGKNKIGNPTRKYPCIINTDIPSLTRASFLPKYSYSTMMNDECSLVSETVRKWQIVKGGGYSTASHQFYSYEAGRKKRIVNLDSGSLQYHLIPKWAPRGGNKVHDIYRHIYSTIQHS